MKKRFLTLLSLCVLSLLVLLPTSTNAYFGTENYFDGGQIAFGTGNLTSVYVDIKTPDYPYVYFNSGSSAWPMIVNRSTSPSTSYVQVGWTKDNYVSQNNGVHYFYEVYYGNVGNDYQVYSTVGPASLSTHGYRVSHTGPDPDPNGLGYWVGTVDGAQISSYPSTFSGHEAEYYEEIYGGQAYNAQFAGRAGNHAIFSNIRAFSNGITYYSPSLSWLHDTDGMQDTSHYIPGNASSTLELWDSRY
jgi:hypothetical protein